MGKGGIHKCQDAINKEAGYHFRGLISTSLAENSMVPAESPGAINWLFRITGF